MRFNLLSNNFWKKINKTSTCWEWTGYIDRDGYGVFNGNFIHRLTYQEYYGEIQSGLEIDHLCRNRGCCNPEHLEAVTHKENILRGESFAAKEARQIVCPKGHEYTQEKKGRRCLVCQSIYKQEYYQTNKAKIKKNIMIRYYEKKLEEVVIG